MGRVAGAAKRSVPVHRDASRRARGDTSGAAGDAADGTVDTGGADGADGADGTGHANHPGDAPRDGRAAGLVVPAAASASAAVADLRRALGDAKAMVAEGLLDDEDFGKIKTSVLAGIAFGAGADASSAGA